MAAAMEAQQPHLPDYLLPPPQPPQPFFHRASSSCDRHPDQPVTGFCASCLRERLEGLDTANHRLSSSSASSIASAALRSLFFRPAAPHGGHRSNADGNGGGGSSSNPSFVPELRRCKSFSGRPPVPFLPPAEPQRKSCDVRGRNTLWSLFHLDDGGPAAGANTWHRPFPLPVHSAAPNRGGGEIEPEPCSRRLDSISAATVMESREEGKEEEEEAYESEERLGRVDAETEAPVQEDDVRPAALDEDAEVGEAMVVAEELTIKDHMDLNAGAKKAPPKDLKEIAGSFWLAASVFSKKLQKWRRKQKLKKQETQRGADAGSKFPASGIRREKPSSLFRSRRFYREAQSELAEDAFRRRSCDTDPRYSLDAGRMSLDDPRFSWDEPRASWDGYLTGYRPPPPRQPPMLPVTEDAPVSAPAVQRLDGQIPVEEDGTFPFPGGASHTREYYVDASQRRRRSLDRSFSSMRRSFSLEGDEPPRSAMPTSILRAASPTGISTEYFHLVDRFERGDYVRDPPASSCTRDGAGRSESFDSATFRDPMSEGNSKKARRWSKAWSLWGLIHRRGRGRGVGANSAAADRCSFSGPWPEPCRRDGGSTLRCSSSLSSRASSYSRSAGGGSSGWGGARRSGLEINGQGKKRAGEFVLERNRSARLSPGRAADSGMLRFYLTPMRSGSRRGGGAGKAGHQAIHPHSSSSTRSALQLY